jgi:hypothetical protein
MTVTDSHSTRYQVIIACALIPIIEANGAQVVHTLYKGHTFVADPDNERVKHNADSGYIVEIAKNADAGVDTWGTPLVDNKPTVGDGNPGDPVTLNDPGITNDVAHKAAAKAAKAEAAKAAKADDVKPKPVLSLSASDIDALRKRAIASGMSPTEVAKASPEDLTAALSH